MSEGAVARYRGRGGREVGVCGAFASTCPKRSCCARAALSIRPESTYTIKSPRKILEKKVNLALDKTK